MQWEKVHVFLHKFVRFANCTSNKTDKLQTVSNKLHNWKYTTCDVHLYCCFHFLTRKYRFFMVCTSSIIWKLQRHTHIPLFQKRFPEWTTVPPQVVCMLIINYLPHKQNLYSRYQHTLNNLKITNLLFSCLNSNWR